MNKLIRFCIIAVLIFLLSGLLLSACGAAMGGAATPDSVPTGFTGLWSIWMTASEPKTLFNISIQRRSF